MILPLGGCEMVLGIHFLSTLVDIKCNFYELRMEFKFNGKKGGHTNKELQSEIKQLLEESDDVFAVPKCLPPNKILDHIIPLKEGVTSVNIRPYSSSVKTLMVPPNNLGPDLAGKPVNETLYKGMIGYLKGTPSLGLWYLKCSAFDLKGYSDLEYAGCNMDKKAHHVPVKFLECTDNAYDLKPPVDDSEERPLREYKFLDLKTFCEATGLDYNQGTYVSHPSPEAVKAELAKITTDEVNSIQQLIAYCLITGTKVDIREIVYSDLITRLTNKSRQKYVSYPRFVSCALKELLGTEYAQEEKFGSLPNVLSNSNFTKDPSKVTPIKLTASMIVVNNLESLVSQLLFCGKKKKTKSQTVSKPKPKTQGLEASGTLPQKRKNTLTKNTTPQATKTPPTEKVSTEDSDKTQSKPLLKGKTTDAKDPEGNIQPASMGLPSTPLDEGTHKSQPLTESKTTDLKDSEGNKHPADKGLPAMVLDDSIGKTKPLPEGPREDKDSERLKPLADMGITHPSSLLGASDDDLKEDSNDDVFEAGEEMDENIQEPDIEETQTHHSTKHTTKEHQILANLKEVQDAVKEDPALNKKVLEAYIKNSTNLTELLTLVKTFYFSGLKSIVESLKTVVDAQNDHLDTWAKSSTNLAWSVGPRLTKIKHTQALIQDDISSLKENTYKIKRENFAHTTTEEPPSYTEGEKADMDTKEAVEKEQTKEPEVENIMQEPVRAARPIPILLATPKADRGKGKVTNDVESPKKFVKASSKVHPDPYEPIRVPYEIHGKLYHLTNDEIQENLDKEEKIKKVDVEAKLLAMSKPELIKVVHEEALKAGIDHKILESAKGGQEFKKIQDAKMKVLNRGHYEKIKRSRELRKKRIEKYRWTTSSRLKPDHH
ncbi:hypothetical protein Tco_0686066 [Tanacetum coccineum]